MSDKFTVGSSVIMFRLRAERLFHIWAHKWLTEVNKQSVSRRDVELLSERIQMAYRDVLRRNPSIHEWVSAVLHYSSVETRHYMIAENLRLLNLAVDDATFNATKPWWLWYQLAGRNDQKALQAFSAQVGRTFLHLTHRDTVLSPDADWTDGLNIEDFLVSVAKPLKTKHFWQFWK